MEKSSSAKSNALLESKDKEPLEELIKDETESGIRPFVSRMFDIYRTMYMYDWKDPGEYYVGPSRVAFFNQENLQYLIDRVPGLELRAAGRDLGRTMAVSLGANQNDASRRKENWARVLKRLRVFGYGDFFLKGDHIVAKNPFLADRTLLTGFLEGVLGVRVEMRSSRSPRSPIVFVVSNESETA